MSTAGGLGLAPRESGRMGVDELRKTEAAYRKAAAKAEELRQARNEAVRRALDEGLTHQQIADATGLTRGRINQLRDPPSVSQGPGS